MNMGRFHKLFKFPPARKFWSGISFPRKTTDNKEKFYIS